MSRQKTVYAPFNNFGTTCNTKVQTDPVAWSLYGNTLDASFSIGSYGVNKYGLQSSNAQTYLAERCSKNFDEVCQYVSTITDIQKSNTARVSTPSQSACQYQTVGQALLDNAGQRRFGDLSNCQRTQWLFNEMDPNSPLLTNYSTIHNVVFTPPPNPDSDALLNRILDEPQYHMDLLINMYNNTRNRKNEYKNTRIGKLFDIIENNLL
jgi:hypothetical protein